MGAGPLSLRLPDGGPVHRALAAEVAAARDRAGGAVPRVLDVGGGTGGWAVPLALAGCAVTVVDRSPNALAALERRAREAGVHGLVRPVQGDVDALADVVPDGESDLVLGHGLLEVVDDAGAALAALRAATASGGAVSVLVAGRYAAALARTVGGRLAEARAVLTDPEGRYGPGDAVRRRLDVAGLRALLAADGGLLLELVQGDGVLECCVPGAVRDGGPAAGRALVELEAAAAGHPALLDVSARLHALARRVSS